MTFQKTGNRENELVLEQLQSVRKITVEELSFHTRIPPFEVEHILRRLAILNEARFNPIDNTWSWLQ